MGPGLGRQRSGAASPSGGAGSGADRAGFTLSTVCTAAEGKEGVAEERVWGGVPSPAGWLAVRGGGGLTSPPGRSQSEAPVPAEHPGSSRPQGRAGAGDGGAIAAVPPRAAARPPAGERG